jgi:hypothetical protein
MRNRILCVLLGFVCLSSFAFAEEDKDYSCPKTPWLKNVKISPYITEPSPTIPLNIFGENGMPIPATITEDMPIMVMAESAIFEPYPPDHDRGVDLVNSRWDEKPVMNWYFADWELQRNTNASISEELAINQAIIVPTRPTSKGAILCFSSRKMRYDIGDGRTKATYVNSSRGADVTVLDITPPLCGFEITTKDGHTGTCWPVENPPDKYPLPKYADIYFSGSLFGATSEEKLIPEVELGDNMMVDPYHAALLVTRRDVLTIKVIGEDNYKLDTDRIRFAICDGPAGALVSPENQEVIHISKLKLPERPYLFLEAYDVSGNKQAMYIPIKVVNRR